MVMPLWCEPVMLALLNEVRVNVTLIIEDFGDPLMVATYI